MEKRDAKTKLAASIYGVSMRRAQQLAKGWGFLAKMC